MRFQVGRVHRDRLRILPLARQFGQHSRKHPRSAPPHPSVIKRLWRTLLPWRIPPTQAIAMEEDNSAQHTLVVNARNAVGQRKKWFQPLHLRICQPEKITHAAPPWMLKVNQTKIANARELTGPDPIDLDA